MKGLFNAIRRSPGLISQALRRIEEHETTYRLNYIDLLRDEHRCIFESLTRRQQRKQYGTTDFATIILN